jgi:hypothetical protein
MGWAGGSRDCVQRISDLDHAPLFPNAGFEQQSQVRSRKERKRCAGPLLLDVRKLPR